MCFGLVSIVPYIDFKTVAEEDKFSTMFDSIIWLNFVPHTIPLLCKGLCKGGKLFVVLE